MITREHVYSYLQLILRVSTWSASRTYTAPLAEAIHRVKRNSDIALATGQWTRYLLYQQVLQALTEEV